MTDLTVVSLFDGIGGFHVKTQGHRDGCQTRKKA